MSVITNNTIQPSSGQALTIKDEGGTASITVATNGEATFAENIKITASKGIDFSAYATSGNPSSNLLDDYEEGSFDLVFSANSNTHTRTLYYIKCGRIVTISGRVVLFVGAGGPYDIALSSGTLPFVPDTNTSANIPSYQNRLILNSENGPSLMSNYGASSLEFKKESSGSEATSPAAHSVVQKSSNAKTDSYLFFQGTYISAT